jgi:hypothetical protein
VLAGDVVADGVVADVGVVLVDGLLPDRCDRDGGLVGDQAIDVRLQVAQAGVALGGGASAGCGQRAACECREYDGGIDGEPLGRNAGQVMPVGVVADCRVELVVADERFEGAQVGWVGACAIDVVADGPVALAAAGRARPRPARPDRVQRHVDAGFDKVYVQQIGADQDTFFAA